MGKNKKKLRAAVPRRPQQHQQQQQQLKTKKPVPKKAKNEGTQQRQHSTPTIPFAPSDRILLIGDGDLSFARSLHLHHGCTHVTATVLESSADELAEKYPQVVEHIREIEQAGGTIKFGVDATKMAPLTDKASGHGIMNRIFFNFPHVGGKSTDVNRQVRYNQELLVSFFKKAMPSLAPGGTIIVTLFEGEPYTLWNIRDLGRHSGLQVERSFAFQAAAYPGYHHARTLGAIKGKDGEIGGGWKGEDRAARSYIFTKKGETSTAVSTKRKRDSDSDSDSEDD